MLLMWDRRTIREDSATRLLICETLILAICSNWMCLVSFHLSNSLFHSTILVHAVSRQQCQHPSIVFLPNTHPPTVQSRISFIWAPSSTVNISWICFWLILIWFLLVLVILRAVACVHVILFPVWELKQFSGNVHHVFIMIRGPNRHFLAELHNVTDIADISV